MAAFQLPQVPLQRSSGSTDPDSMWRVTQNAQPPAGPLPTQIDPATYDEKQAVLFALPDTGAVVNVNTLPEAVIDQLIQKYGVQGPLVGRKQYFEAQNKAKADQRTQEQMTEARIQEEAGKRTNASLQGQLESIFGGVEQAATGKINDQYAQMRAKQVAEEGALGRLTSPNSIIPLSQIDRSQGMALSDAIGQIQAQKAAGQLDVSKAIEQMLQSQRALDQNNSQFGQTLGFSRDKLQSDINQAAEDRGLTRSVEDARLRQKRDLSEPDEWAKQLDRINGVTNTIGNISKVGKEVGGSTADIAKLFMGGA